MTTTADAPAFAVTIRTLITGRVRSLAPLLIDGHPWQIDGAYCFVEYDRRGNDCIQFRRPTTRGVFRLLMGIDSFTRLDAADPARPWRGAPLAALTAHAERAIRAAGVAPEAVAPAVIRAVRIGQWAQPTPLALAA